ncbi:MAG: BatD family protein [Candidatus Latescibacteria bacterium]|nr:BatD family protein [Candidatus Latescibacterota bacterium]
MTSLAKMLRWAAPLIALYLPVCALALTVEATINRNPVPVGHQAILTLEISGNKIEAPSPPKLPSRRGVIITGPDNAGTSTLINIVNGAMTRTTTHRFQWKILFRRPGEYLVPRFSFRTSEGTAESKAIKVLGVLAAARGTPAEKAFMRISLSVAEPFRGQPLMATYTLFVQGQPNASVEQHPTFTGFWSEVFYYTTQTAAVERTREIIDGISYTSIPILKVLLIPTTTGELTVDALRMRVTVQTPTGRRTFWGPEYHTETLTIASQPMPLKVKPLPSGAPSDFSGAVGQFGLEATSDRTDVSEGDPITLRVSVVGQGNLKTAGDPTAPRMTDFRVYDPQTSSQISVDGGVMKGSRTYEYVLIPEAAGRAVIHPFRMPYFDPERETYRIAKTSRIDVIVAKTTADPTQPQSVSLGLTQRQIEALGSDIAYIKPDLTKLKNSSWRLYHAPGYLWWHLLPPLFVVAAYGVRSRRRWLGQDVARVRATRAAGEARSRLKTAKKFLRSDEPDVFYSEIARTVTQFVADHTDSSAQGMTSPVVSQGLSSSGIKPELTSDMVNVLDACDAARFSPTSSETEAMEQLFARTSKLMQDLSKAMKP